MKVLFWVGLVVLVFGTASFFLGLPSPDNASSGMLPMTLRVVLFISGLGMLLAGVAWD
jgi:hypothetical protein